MVCETFGEMAESIEIIFCHVCCGQVSLFNGGTCWVNTEAIETAYGTGIPALGGISGSGETRKESIPILSDPVSFAETQQNGPEPERKMWMIVHFVRKYMHVGTRNSESPLICLDTYTRGLN